MADPTDPRTVVVSAVDELKKKVTDLYYEAGTPPFRQIARALHRSAHSTIHYAINEPAHSRWGLLSEVLVQLGGEPGEFLELYRAAQAERKAAPRAGTAAVIHEYPAPLHPRLAPEVVLTHLREEYGWATNMVGLIVRPRKGSDWAELTPADARELAAELARYADEAQQQS